MLLLLAIAAPLSAQEPTPPPAPEPTPAPAADPVLVGAGDIADCGQLSGAAKTAVLLDRIDGTVFTLGDNAYESGTPKQFADCYAPTWGRHKARTRPAVGQSRVQDAGGGGLLRLLRRGGGRSDEGLLQLRPRGLARRRDQQQLRPGGRLRPRLAAGRLAAGRPRSAPRAVHGGDVAPPPLLLRQRARRRSRRCATSGRSLYDAGADLVAVRPRAQLRALRAAWTPTAGSIPARGIRQFVVGTGGRELYAWGRERAGSQVKNNETFGVLKLTLHRDGYDWEFVPVDGQTFTDAGSDECHGRTRRR